MMAQTFVVLNYVVLGVVLMYYNLVVMRDAFAQKHSLAIGITYYVLKFFVDYGFYSNLADMPDSFRLMGFAWGMLIICLTFPLCALLFWGGLAELYASFTAVNAILSVMQLSTFYLTNFLLGKPVGSSFQESYGLGTVLALVILTAEFFCLRQPLAWMARGIRHFPHRYQVLLDELAFLATTGFIFSLYRPVSDADTSGVTVAYWKLIVFSAAPLLVIALLQLSLSRRARAQTLYIKSVEELMRSYRRKIHAQLDIAERDRKLFDGLSEELERLGERSGSDELLERIRLLEDQYERIKEGTYCENPVYDAFLCAQASRLERLGVCPHFSVALLPPTMGVRPQLLLILLSEVDRLALHAKRVEGSEVNLRIRSLNGMMHVSLDMPSSWGRLRAQQLLEDAGFGDELLVSEKVKNGRTEVLVMSQKKVPCSSS